MKRLITTIILFTFVLIFIQSENTFLADTLVLRNNQLDEVVVTGARIPMRRNVLSVPVSVVSRETIEQSFETNLLPTVMQQVPGLFVTSRGMAGYGVSTGAAGGINLRGFGGAAGRVLILIDGHPQYATIYGHPVADAYLASEAQQVEVHRGAASVLYGSNAMGGAINIITRKAVEDGNNLNVRMMGGSYGTQRYSLTHSHRKNRLSSVVSANFESTEGHRPNSDFQLWSSYAKIGYNVNKNWDATANVSLSKSQGGNPGAVSKPMLEGRANVLRGMLGVSLANHYKNTNGAINLYYNGGKHKINDGYSEGEVPQPFLFHSTDYMSGVNVYQTISPFKGNSITAGIDVKIYGGNAYRNPETEHYADHVELNEVAGYLSAHQSLGKIMINGGIRLENHNLYGIEWVPQAGVSMEVARDTHLKYSVSKGFRTPNMRELYMFAPANEELLPEHSWSHDVSLLKQFMDKKLSMELNLFYTKGDNIVQVVMVDGKPQNQNVGKFANKGVEYAMNYRVLKNLSLNANYSYLHMNNLITGSPRHKLYVGANLASGKFRYNIGAQIIDKLYLSTDENPQTSNYTLIDAKVSYAMMQNIDLFIKGDNLLAQKYETMLGFVMPRATFLGGVVIRL